MTAVYWGSTDSTAIVATIYDYYDDSGLGIVDISPWTNAPHDSLFPVAPPEIPDLVIYTDCDSISCDNVYLIWDSVPGATYYTVYSADDPVGPFIQDLTGTFNDTTWIAPIPDEEKFYYVTAGN